jgi:nucleoside-diphosphate-sugar epimerase
MNPELPGILVTGASGFIGRHFLEAVRGKYRLFCLARRSQKESGIPRDPNLRWTQVDIARWNILKEVARCVLDHGGADYVLHLAGYYDFSGLPNPEYERTNVEGTRNVLRLAELIGIKRFMFASSLAAFRIPKQVRVLDESSVPDADFPYAWSKRVGEELIKERADRFSVSIIRLAAVYSDWCEYAPLYMFLRTWSSKAWNSRLLGGKGQSALSYIHIHDLIELFTRVIDKHDQLPRSSVFVASPDDSFSHLDLFKAATRFYFGRDIKPIKIPKAIAFPGILLRQFFGWISGRPPFERSWMVPYIDRKLLVDSKKTQAELEWAPTPRFNLIRRLLILVENMKNYESVWKARNEAVMQRVTERPNLILYEAMTQFRDEFLEEATAFMLLPNNRKRFRDYHEMEPDVLKWYLALLYQVAAAAVRTKDRMFVRNYAQIIAYRRFQSGFQVDEVEDFLISMAKIISLVLQVKGELKGMRQNIHDYIDLSFQLAADEVEDIYEMLEKRSPEVLDRVKKIEIRDENADIQRIIRKLEDICFDSLDSPLSSLAALESFPD